MASAEYLLITVVLFGHTLPETMESDIRADATEDSGTFPSWLEHFSTATPNTMVLESLQSNFKIIDSHFLNADNLRQEELNSTIATDGHFPNTSNHGTVGVTSSQIIDGHSPSDIDTGREVLTNSWETDGHSPSTNDGDPERLMRTEVIGGPTPNISEALLLEAEPAAGNATVVSSTEKVPLETARPVRKRDFWNFTMLPTLPTPGAQPRAVRPFSGDSGRDIHHPNISMAAIPIIPIFKLHQEDMTCDNKGTVEGGHIVWPEKRTVGSVLKHICPEGHRAFPVSWRVCNRWGKWSSLRNAYKEQATSASCKLVTCLGRITFKHGSFHPRKTYYKVNDTIQFECFAGFQLLGSAVRTCVPNGHWSGEMTTCQTYLPESMCPDPGIPIGGSRSGDQFGLTPVVSYRCEVGELRGSARRECLPSGKWSGEPPRCEGWMAFDDWLDLEKELHVLEAQIRSSAHGSSDVSLNPLIGKSHKVFFVVEASTGVGQENFDTGLNFIKKFVKKVSIYKTKLYFGVVFFGLTATTMEKVEDRWIAEEVIQALNRTRYKEYINQSFSDLYEALREVLLSVTRDSSASSTKYTIIIITCRHQSRGQPSSVIGEIARQAEKTGAHLEILVIGIGDIKKDELERLVLPKNTMEEGRQYAFYLPYYDDLDKIYSAPPKDHTDVFSQCGVQSGTVQKPMGRIFGGKKASLGDWPWQAYINLPIFFCGGSVIGKEWILSAAHCFDDEDGRLLVPEKVNVSVGILSTQKKQALLVEKIIQHELWNSTSKDYDIALLKLRNPIVYSEKVRPVCLPCMDSVREIISIPGTSWNESCKFQENLLTVTGEEKYERSLWGYVAGWGYQFNTVKSISLLHIKVEIKPRYQCQPRHNIPFTENMFCARGPQTDACSGDSGGPFVMKIRNRWVQVGIVSFGRYQECGKDDFMGFYASVPRLMGWVRSQTGIK